tara:strand:+ start:510 stop:821 length:312 start_codon:yes stop_codon:yes gene_type:complete
MNGIINNPNQHTRSTPQSTKKEKTKENKEQAAISEEDFANSTHIPGVTITKNPGDNTGWLVNQTEEDFANSTPILGVTITKKPGDNTGWLVNQKSYDKLSDLV